MVSSRVLVSLPEETLRLIEKIEGLGNNRSDRIRNIVMAWLSDQNHFKTNEEKEEE